MAPTKTSVELADKVIRRAITCIQIKSHSQAKHEWIFIN